MPLRPVLGGAGGFVQVPATSTGTGDALTTDPLSQFASTTSLQLKGVLSDETGSGAAVFANTPTLIAPLLGTPTSGVATNLTGTASGLTAGTVTTNANLTGDVTSVGNASTIGAGKVTDAKASLLVKPAIAVVGTSNLTLSGEQTIDGQLTSASLVLATAQSTGAENGPWVSAAGAWARPTWYTSGSTTQAPQFLTTFVRLGTTYQGSTWRMTTAAVTIDTTSTTWVQTPIALGNLGSSTSVAISPGTIELGHASDTTIARSSSGAVTVEGVQVLLSGAALGTPASGTLTNCTALPVAGITASTATALGVGSVELGHASDTTIARSGAGAVTVEGVQVILSGAALGTPASGTLTNCTALPVAGITASTATALGVGSIELGHASDTTIARSGAGAVTVEGVQVILSGAAGGTPSSLTLTNATALPVSGITASTSTALGVGSIELGHASDTTIARSGAGAVTVEGVQVILSGAALGTPSSGTMTNVSGTAASLTAGNATKWTTGRTVATTGDVTYTSGSLDGSGNVTGTATLANVPVAATFASDLTALPLNLGGWTEYFVTTSNAATTGQSLVDITGLISGTLTASAQYEFEANLRVTTSADTAGIKYGIHVAGTGTAGTCNVIGSASTTGTAAANFSISAVDTGTTAVMTTSGISGAVFIRGYITATSTGTSTVSLQHLKFTSGTSTVQVGSVMRIRKAHT